MHNVCVYVHGTYIQTYINIYVESKSSYISHTYNLVMPQIKHLFMHKRFKFHLFFIFKFHKFGYTTSVHSHGWLRSFTIVL